MNVLSSVTLSLVLLFRAVLALVRSIFSEYNSRTYTRSRRAFSNMIHVKWGRDVLHFPIPPLDTPLGKLRADLAAYTHLPVGSFKLVYKGAVMIEDTAPCTSRSVVCLFGFKDAHTHKPFLWTNSVDV